MSKGKSKKHDSLFIETVKGILKSDPRFFLEFHIKEKDPNSHENNRDLIDKKLNNVEILCLQYLGVGNSTILATTSEDFEILSYRFPIVYEYIIKAEKIISLMEKHGIKILRFSEPYFPEHLRKIENDCPPIIYLQGNHKLLNNFNPVAIIGSTDCSLEGRKKSYKLGFEYGRKGNIVISGLALGCDTEAHNGSLDWRGKTLAIVGSGLDILYPNENIKLKERILSEGGLLISEQPFGIKDEPRKRSAKCRIQAALSEKIIVAECKINCGTMETVNFAQKYGKEILAATYPIYNEYNLGNKFLIENQIAKPL